MTVMQTQATYKNGVVIPKTKPPFGQPYEVLVTFIKKGNALESLKVLKQYAGTLPKTFPSGKSYISKLRHKLSKEWENHLAK